MTITVRRIEPHDDRTRFRSGDIELDRFFALYAGQNQFRHHYQRFGFIPLEVTVGGLGDRPQPLPMFLELGAIPKPESE